MDPIPIFKGDSTDAFGVRVIKINLTTEVSLVGATATFSLLSFKKNFTSAELATKVLTFAISAEATRRFPIGTIYGKLCLYDSDLRVMTAACHIPFKVCLPGNMHGGLVCVKTPTAEITVTMGVDYSLAYNKPTINGVEVSGDKAGKDYGLNRILDYSPTSSYEVGDQVMNGRVFYKCIVDIVGGESWNPNHWIEIGGGTDPNSVHYTEDSAKSQAEKSQARQNIGAASTADLSSHTSNKKNPHVVTKSQIGLSNVDNTSDANKPISSAQQTALKNKVSISALKAAFTSPDDVKLAAASIKEYLTKIYNAIQAIENS